MPDDAIKGSLQTQAFLLLLKHVMDPNLFTSLPKIFGLLNAFSKAEKGSQYQEIFLRYLMTTVEDSQSQDFQKEIKKSLKKWR